jgi:DNA-binding HxlR family transcriptional regulator
MQRTRFDSMPCPLARALEHLSDSWNVLILREAFCGARRFDDFASKLEIPSNTLTARLKSLVAGGILERRQYNERPPRFEYVLSEKGRDLRPVMLTLLAWGNKYDAPPNVSVRLVDQTTGQPVEQLALIDAQTGKHISTDHVVVRTTAAKGTPRTLTYPFPDTNAPEVSST